MGSTREQIITTLVRGLQSDPHAHAMWLEGADAEGRVDAYSDLDIWLDVDDGAAEAVFAAARALLLGLGPLDYEHQLRHPHPQIHHTVYHLQGTPETLILDLCLQDHSRAPSLFAGFGEIAILFDKDGAATPHPADWEAFRRETSQRAEELYAEFPLAPIRVRKELARGNFLEALNYYQGRMLAPLVELLRFRYRPVTYDFGLKHIAHDVPADVCARLEYLYSVSSRQDIATRCPEAEAWFWETAEAVRGAR